MEKHSLNEPKKQDRIECTVEIAERLKNGQKQGKNADGVSSNQMAEMCRLQCRNYLGIKNA